MMCDGNDAIAVRVVTETDFDHVFVAGDVDLHTQRHLVDVFAEEGRLTEANAVIDLNDVDFLDSMGLAALVKARRLLAARAAELWVVCADGRVCQVLRMARLGDVLNVVGSFEETTLVSHVAL